LGKIETKSSNQDYQSAMSILYRNDKIEHIQKEKQDQKKTTEKDLLENLEKENLKYNSNFFNKFSMKILENSSSQILVNIACKSFVGDTDVPHDKERSFLLLRLAKLSCKNEQELKETEFYLDYFRKTGATNKKDVDEAHNNLRRENDYIKAKYVNSRDLFKIVTYNLFNILKEEIPAKEKYHIYSTIFECMEEASNCGIYEAYYYLGLIYLHGYYPQINKQKAFYYFCLAASYSHSLAYYELYKMLKNNSVDIYDDTLEARKSKNRALFHYLKLSAEEGYIEAMHELGNIYITGELNKKNKLKALAWHRHACRNGHLLSYEPCGDILYTGGDGVKQDKALSLVMYYCAYVKGIPGLKEKIELIIQELKVQGEPIPEMILN
jgi:TPR repeat protein